MSADSKMILMSRPGPGGIERVKVEAPCETAGIVSRQQREGGWGEGKKGRRRTDVCDLCLAP